MNHLMSTFLFSTMFVACNDKGNSETPPSSQVSTGKAEPPNLNCEDIDLKELSEIAGTTYTHSSPKIREPDVCTFKAGMSGQISVRGVGGRTNISETRIANYGNEWTKDKDIPVNVSPYNDRLGMGVTVYGDFLQKQGVHVSLSGLPMTREEYGKLEQAKDRKEAFKKAYETNVDVALYLVHQFHAQTKGKKVNPEPLIDPTEQVSKKSADFDCSKLDFTSIKEKLNKELRVTSQKRTTTCSIETSDGFLFQLRSTHHKDKQSFAQLYSRDARWTHKPEFDQVITETPKTLIRKGGIRFQNGLAVHITISPNPSAMLKFVPMMESEKGRAEFDTTSTALFSEICSEMQKLLAP